MGFFHWLHKDVYREICRLEERVSTQEELQAELDARADRTEAAVANIAVEVQNLKDAAANQPGITLDFSRLDAAVSAVEDADGVPGADGPTPPEATPPVTNPVL